MAEGVRRVGRPAAGAYDERRQVRVRRKMFRVAVTVASVVLYVGVMLGCMLSAGPEQNRQVARLGRPQTVRGATRVAGLPFRGVAVQLQRIDWMDSEYRKAVDEIADLGADTVSFVVDARMENGSSSRIYLDMRSTPTPDELISLIQYAKQEHGLRVVLMPIVLLDRPRGLEWRGTINPEDWSEWWASYRAMLYHYCWIAESAKVDLLVVGSELVSTESKAEQWRQTIDMVRQNFRGLITYSSNWDHYDNIPFWEQLDLIGMNSYWKLGEDHTVSVEEIVARWKKIKRTLYEFQQKKGKPLILLEAGWCSLQNAADESWDYTKETVPIDLDLQRRLYEGFFRSWYGEPWFGGFMIWEWPPSRGGPENRGYTPKNKPAEQVLREWLKKPRWEVR